MLAGLGVVAVIAATIAVVGLVAQDPEGKGLQAESEEAEAGPGEDGTKGTFRSMKNKTEKAEKRSGSKNPLEKVLIKDFPKPSRLRASDPSSFQWEDGCGMVSLSVNSGTCFILIDTSSTSQLLLISGLSSRRKAARVHETKAQSK